MRPRPKTLPMLSNSLAVRHETNYTAVKQPLWECEPARGDDRIFYKEIYRLKNPGLGTCVIFVLADYTGVVIYATDPNVAEKNAELEQVVRTSCYKKAEENFYFRYSNGKKPVSTHPKDKDPFKEFFMEAVLDAEGGIDSYTRRLFYGKWGID